MFDNKAIFSIILNGVIVKSCNNVGHAESRDAMYCSKKYWKSCLAWSYLFI